MEYTRRYQTAGAAVLPEFAAIRRKRSAVCSSLSPPTPAAAIVPVGQNAVGRKVPEKGSSEHTGLGNTLSGADPERAQHRRALPPGQPARAGSSQARCGGPRAPHGRCLRRRPCLARTRAAASMTTRRCKRRMRCSRGLGSLASAVSTQGLVPAGHRFLKVVHVALQDPDVAHRRQQP
jgi:hypothetical protein